MTDASSRPVIYTGFYDTESRPVHGVVPVEQALTLYVNGEPLVGLMCTPTMVEELAVGFLYNEGFITGLDDVSVVAPCGDGRCVDVWLDRSVEVPGLRRITSGCAGGTTFEEEVTAQGQIDSARAISPSQATRLLASLLSSAETYRRAGGVHAAGLSDGDTLLCVAEDIGRHNALDKISGLCLRRGLASTDAVLLTSGRVSSEMVQKAARMRAPIVISRTSPTSLSVRLAEAWNITLIGYTRRRSLRVYSGQERVVPAPP
jgi:FdhD protein